MIIISIDIGVINMGITKAFVDDDFNITFMDAFKVDITRMRHNTVQACDCIIPHTKEVCDRVAHLIERQPPMGIKDVESLIMSRFRNKTKLISPNKMHKFFNIGKLSYDQRKLFTEEVADIHIGHIPTYYNCIRRHDMADACCICLCFLNSLKREYEKNQRRENIKRLPFDEYRFTN